MKTRTAVEFLFDKLELNPDCEADFEWNKEIWKTAFKMEKQQIIEAHGDKQKTKSNPDSLVTYGYWYSGKDYYKEKYEK